jgi:hypothetical protein
MSDITCDGCFQTLDERHFGTQSREHEELYGGLWCNFCIQRERVGLPRRVPTFGGPNTPAGPNANWVIDTFLDATNPSHKAKKTFAVLLAIAGYLDNEPPIDDIGIRDLYNIFQRQIPMLRILQIIHKLEREGWLVVFWATEPYMTNKYQLNKERIPTIHHDPHEHTYRKEKK